SRSTLALANSSSGPASAAASSSEALPNAPACRLARAAPRARLARRARGGARAPAGLGPARRPLELCGDLLIRPGRGLGPVPCPAVKVGRRVGNLREREVSGQPVR